MLRFGKYAYGNSTPNMFEDLITSLCKSITDKYL